MRRPRDARRFADRREAGRLLGARLAEMGLAAEDPLVVGLPRGGVPVALEVAAALGAPLDITLIRKLGAPAQPEYAIGALGEDDVTLLDRIAVKRTGTTREELEAILERESRELTRRQRTYREGRAPASVAGRTVVVVDDGIATGLTALAAVRVLRHRGARSVVLAVPVAPPRAEARFGDEVDSFVALSTPEDFWAVGQFYEDFSQTTDDDVTRLLAAAHARAPTGGPVGPARATDDAAVVSRSVDIPHAAVTLPGDLRLPAAPRGLVIFAHGSGSGRRSPRNVQVASDLNRAGLGTLLFDLLTPAEADDRANVFDIPLLARRLAAATRWARSDRRLDGLPIGYFGASTGAAAALCAAADLGPGVAAVVSRGGRPDLAGERLAEVVAPTLLIVGGADLAVLDLNREAARRLSCPHDLAVVPGATHLFEEPGALEQVSELAAGWFVSNLARPAATSATVP